MFQKPLARTRECQNANVPMFWGVCCFFIVSGLFEYCGTIIREKRTREEGEEYIYIYIYTYTTQD